MSRVTGKKRAGNTRGSQARATRAARKPAGLLARARRALPPWAQPLIRQGKLTAIALVVAIAAPAAWYSGAVQAGRTMVTTAALDASAQAGFRIERVLVAGRSQTDRDALLAILNIRVGDPIFAFDPRQAQSMIEQLSWVDHAQVERRLPGTILLTIEERQPMALWQRNRELVAIDQDGIELTSRELGRFDDLPILVGKAAPDPGARLLDLLDRYPALGNRVEAATWIGDRRWDLRLDNGVEIRLPEDGFHDAIAQLSELAEWGDWLDRDIVTVDMRLSDRMIVQTRQTIRTGGPARGTGI